MDIDINIINFDSKAEMCRFLAKNFVILPLVKWERLYQNQEKCDSDKLISQLMYTPEDFTEEDASDLLNDLKDDLDYYFGSTSFVNDIYGEDTSWLIDKEFKNKYNKYWNNIQKDIPENNFFNRDTYPNAIFLDNFLDELVINEDGEDGESYSLIGYTDESKTEPLYRIKGVNYLFDGASLFHRLND